MVKSNQVNPDARINSQNHISKADQLRFEKAFSDLTRTNDELQETQKEVNESMSLLERIMANRSDK